MNGLSRDEIIRGFLNLHPDTPIDMTEYAIPLLMVRQLAGAIAAAEREACAKVCDAHAEYAEKWGTWGQVMTFDRCATAIRARGNDAA